MATLIAFHTTLFLRAVLRIIVSWVLHPSTIVCLQSDVSGGTYSGVSYSLINYFVRLLHSILAYTCLFIFTCFGFRFYNRKEFLNIVIPRHAGLRNTHNSALFIVAVVNEYRQLLHVNVFAFRFRPLGVIYTTGRHHRFQVRLILLDLRLKISSK